MPAKAFTIRLYVGIPPGERSPETLVEVGEMISAYFSDATIHDVYGLWEGKLESTLLIDIVTSGDRAEELARSLADDLRQRFVQESVLMTVTDLASHELIS